MLKQTVGIVIGACIGVAIIKSLHNRNKQEERNFVTVNSKDDVEKELKDFSGLLQEQLVLEYLSGDELSKWFREYSSLTDEKVNKIIAYPTKDILNGLGYKFNKELDIDKSIIQLFYNTEEEKIAKSRFISFVEIDDKLEEILKKNGMLIVD